MSPGRRRGDATARCAREETEAYEEGLGELLDRLALLGDRHREGRDADRSAAEAAAKGVQHGTIETIEAEIVDLVQLQGGSGDPLPTTTSTRKSSIAM